MRRRNMHMIGRVLSASLFLLIVLITGSAEATVLWNQPLSSVNDGAYPSQNITDYPDYSSYIADDFTNTTAWTITKIFIPGDFWSEGSSFANATSLNFAIYGNNSGLPSGYPGSAVWSISLAYDDVQLSYSTGTSGYASNVTLTLATPVNLTVGTWWLVFYPEMTFENGGQYGLQVSDTTNGYTALSINPGGAFGYGTDWQDLSTAMGIDQTDIAFRLEGTAEIPVPEPSMLLLLGLALAGLRVARKQLKP